MKKYIRYRPDFISIFLRGILALFTLVVSLSVSAQQRDSLKQIRAVDTSGILDKIKKAGEDEAKKSIAKFNAIRTAVKQEELIEEIKKTTRKAKDYLKEGVDTIIIKEELIHLKNWSAIAGDGVFTNKGASQTYRNMATTSMILNELLNMAVTRKNELDRFEKNLIKFRYKIDSLSGDTVLYSFVGDSLSVIQYAKKIIGVAYEIGPADSAVKQAINDVLGLQTELNFVVNKLGYELEETEGFQKELSGKIFNQEFVNLGSPLSYDRPFGEIIQFSKAKGKLTLKFYAQNHSGKMLLVLVLIAAVAFFLRTLKQICIQKDLLRTDFTGQLILRYPTMSAIVIILSLFQFIFPAPPFIFSCLFWMTGAVCLTIIFRNFITGYWMSVWLTMLILSLVGCAINLILQASLTERWGMLFFASSGVVIGSIILFRGRKHELREKYMIYFISLVVVLELASLFANIYGRYNLSKALLTSGYFNVVIGILFLWTVRLINEGLSLASRIYTGQERKLFYINFERVGEKAPSLLYVLLVVGWFILIARNFYAFKLITEPLRHFLTSERTVGEYSFTINNLLVFVLILTLSVIISRIVSFFASDKHLPNGEHTTERRAGIGSWLLLIRVSIICAGLFLAFAAAGLPMDRIAIILGALGVGVGFGLQTLVNNLVSGLIIAFEKPVNVGDIVEIAGQAGTMKSIGFRSSIISKWEGADVVIPNGELLNAHLVNWTLGGSKKRLDILVGIAYGTDLQKVKQILGALLASNEQILHFPEPVVQFQDFNSSSIDVKIFFWVNNLKDGPAVKSDIITAIDIAFKDNAIVIPFPQQDLHIHTLDAKNFNDKDIERGKQ